VGARACRVVTTQAKATRITLWFASVPVGSWTQVTAAARRAPFVEVAFPHGLKIKPISDLLGRMAEALTHVLPEVGIRDSAKLDS
jgi:hypothetical protein